MTVKSNDLRNSNFIGTEIGSNFANNNKLTAKKKF